MFLRYSYHAKVDGFNDRETEPAQSALVISIGDLRVKRPEKKKANRIERIKRQN